MSVETKDPKGQTSPGVEMWQPESPFLDKPLLVKEESEPKIQGEWNSFESPFLSVYEFEGMEGGEERFDPKSREFLEMLNELHDEEFDEAVQDLVSEASEFLDGQFSGEIQDSSSQALRAEQMLEEYFSPLIRQAGRYIENMLETIGKSDLRNMTDSELETFLDQFDASETNLSPAFEYFLKKLGKKVKSFAKKALKFVGKFTPIGIILTNLKKIIKPLLKQVLKKAINRLPEKLRPIATQLSTKLLKETPDEESSYQYEEPACQEIEVIQNEFDIQIANLLLSNTDVERELSISEYEQMIEGPSPNNLNELEQARTHFIDQVTKLKDDENPTELIENFIPAILAAVRIGIKIIGRKKVVQFLAKLISTLIQRFVGKNNALLLSQAIVDTGLRIMGFEVSAEEQQKLAGSAIASTIEETVARVAALPESVLDNETLLESHVQEIFESAAAGNFPPDFIKPELRETTDIAGTWMMMPVRERRKYYYKKFSKVFENIRITPQMAQQIKTFGGIPLSEYFKNTLALPVDQTIVARVHLYQAIPGTWLSKISKYEKNVPGLGTPSRAAWCQIHPLTNQAAGLLLQQPGLGRTVGAKFLSSPHMIRVGQRFYFLEIPGAKVQIVPSAGSSQRTPLRKNSQVNLTFDFLKNQIRVYIFISETNAQDIATKLRKNYPASAVVKLVRSIYEAGIRTAFSGDYARRVRFIHESVPLEEGLHPIAAGALAYLGKKVTDKLIDKLFEWLGKYVSEYFQQKAEEFRKCTENPADGVTIILTFSNPPGMNIISSILKKRPIQLLGSWFPSGIPPVNIQILAGYRS